MKNINDLSEKLFETLEGLKSGSIKPEQAKAINAVSSTIIQGAKVQLEAVKLMKGSKQIPHIMGVNGATQLAPRKDLYDQKSEFAQSLGYDGLTAAIASLSKTVFEQRFKEEYR